VFSWGEYENGGTGLVRGCVMGASDCLFHSASHAFVIVFQISVIVPCHVWGALLLLDEKTMSSG
jgi:hypothetical protein